MTFFLCFSSSTSSVNAFVNSSELASYNDRDHSNTSRQTSSSSSTSVALERKSFSKASQHVNRHQRQRSNGKHTYIVLSKSKLNRDDYKQGGLVVSLSRCQVSNTWICYAFNFFTTKVVKRLLKWKKKRFYKLL